MEKTGKKPDTQPSQPSSSGFSVPTMVWAILGSILSLIVAVGAGKLSYDRYGSLAWALLATVFSPFYYPYYAYFVSSSSMMPMLGGRRRR